MGVSYRPLDAAVVRTGSERATLVRRTYLLILASIFVTMGGVWYSLNTPAVFNGKTKRQVLDYYKEVIRRIDALPGVNKTAFGMVAPWRDAGAGPTLQFCWDGHDHSAGQEDPRAQYRVISPGFFAALGVPIVAGRDFNNLDVQNKDPVAIVSQTLKLILGTVGAVGNFFIVLFLGLAFAAQPSVYRKGILAMSPVRHRANVETVVDRISNTLERWLIAQMITMTAVSGSSSTPGKTWSQPSARISPAKAPRVGSPGAPS